MICVLKYQVHAEDDEPMLEFEAEAESDTEQDNSEGDVNIDQLVLFLQRIAQDSDL